MVSREIIHKGQLDSSFNIALSSPPLHTTVEECCRLIARDGPASGY